MSLKTELQGAIDYCNTALVNKGADEASTVYEIGDMIDTIHQGGLPVGNQWDDITSFTLSNVAYANYEITIPPLVTSLGEKFTGANRRTGNVIIHKSEGSPITSLYRCFRYTNSNRTFTFDFDTSAVTLWNEIFSRSGVGLTPMSITIIGDLNFSSATNVSNMFTDWLYNASYHSSFRLVEGTLGISWNLGNCNPDDDTLASIVAGLKDMTGQTAQTLTLNANVKTRLTTAQTAEITAKNWTLA